MRSAGRLLCLATLLPLLAACGASGAPARPDAAAGDAALTPCSGDNECGAAETCVTGYCRPVATDAAVDVAIDSAGPPQMSVTPTLLDFGNPILGEEYARTVTVANVGGGVLTVQSINLIEDAAPGSFTLQQTAPFTVAAGDQVALTVVLRLQGTVVPAGSLKIHSDDPSTATRDATVDLVAYAKGSPLLGVCVRAESVGADGGAGTCLVGGDGQPVLDFGAVPYGSSAVRYVEVENAGDGNMPITLQGAALGDGTVTYLTARAFVGGTDGSATLPFLLSIGDPSATPPVAPTTIEVRVVFRAVGIQGSMPGNTLALTSDLAGSPFVVPILGSVLGCSPAPLDGGVVPDGGADPQADPNNCGSCGHVCSTVHASPECLGGTCVLHCESGWADCDNDPATGCETDLGTTTDHCGTCDVKCLNSNGTTACVGGVCHPSCRSGTGDCDGDPKNGCETDILTNVDHCNACTHACVNPHGTTTCSGGVCAPSCAPGWDRCGTSVDLGCTTHTAVDANNCGTCSHVCVNSGGSVSCVGGACQPGCADGYADCDGNASNGCETNVLTDPDHCGGCTTPCSSTHMATRTCSGGQCGGSCADGFADCNHDKGTDGCEVSLLTNPKNCGACGQNACFTTAPATACAANVVVTYSAPGTCSGGACTYPENDAVCPNGGGCFEAQCTAKPTWAFFQGNVYAFVAIAGNQVYPSGGVASSTFGTDFYVETAPKGGEQAVHLFYDVGSNFPGVPGTDLVMQLNQYLGSNEQWKATIPAQAHGTTVFWYVRFDHYDGTTDYWSNNGANYSYWTN